MNQAMTLGELILALMAPDGATTNAPLGELFNKKVRFHSDHDNNLTVLSVYFDEKKRIINVDVG